MISIFRSLQGDVVRNTTLELAFCDKGPQGSLDFRC